MVGRGRERDLGMEEDDAVGADMWDPSVSERGERRVGWAGAGQRVRGGRGWCWAAGLARAELVRPAWLSPLFFFLFFF